MSYAEHLETRATIRTAIIVAVLCGTWLGFFTIYVVDGWCSSCGVPRRLYAFFFWLFLAFFKCDSHLQPGNSDRHCVNASDILCIILCECLLNMASIPSSLRVWISCGKFTARTCFFFWLGYVNSAVNPVLYTVFKAEFRDAFHRLICRRRCCRSPIEEEMEMRVRG